MSVILKMIDNFYLLLWDIILMLTRQILDKYIIVDKVLL